MRGFDTLFSAGNSTDLGWIVVLAVLALVPAGYALDWYWARKKAKAQAK